MCIDKLTIIVSDNGLLPGQHQAIIWVNAGILLVGHLGTNLWNVNRNFYRFIQENAFENIVGKMAAILSQPQCVNGLPLTLKRLGHFFQKYNFIS